MPMIPTDRDMPVNVTGVIAELEAQGYTKEEVLEWFENESSDTKGYAEMYYQAIDAGVDDPLSLPMDELMQYLPED